VIVSKLNIGITLSRRGRSPDDKCDVVDTIKPDETSQDKENNMLKANQATKEESQLFEKGLIRVEQGSNY